MNHYHIAYDFKCSKQKFYVSIEDKIRSLGMNASEILHSHWRIDSEYSLEIINNRLKSFLNEAIKEGKIEDYRLFVSLLRPDEFKYRSWV